VSQARVYQQRFAARQGATLSCEKCGRDIPKGQTYRSFKVGFRSRYDHKRCLRAECAPRMSELESSKLAGVYSAIEGAEDDLHALAPGDNADDINSAVQGAADGIREVASEYDEAADAMGDAGEENRERSSTLESAADELEGFEASENEPDFDGCDNPAHDDEPPEGTDAIERGSDDCEDCRQIKESWWDEMIGEAEAALADVELP
jgi:hypothetical protein